MDSIQRFHEATYSDRPDGDCDIKVREWTPGFSRHDITDESASSSQTDRCYLPDPVRDLLDTAGALSVTIRCDVTAHCLTTERGKKALAAFEDFMRPRED